MDKSDRRTQPRVALNHSALMIKPVNIFSSFLAYNGPNEIVNLSKSGAGIVSTHPLSKGEEIKIKIVFSNEKDMVLKGQIRWAYLAPDDGKYRAGIQFNPFGYKKYYNSIENLIRLDSLTLAPN